MHELSISQNIIEILKENVPEEDYGNVKMVILEIGELSGIVADSLQFCFDVIKIETPFQNAEMKITNISFKLYCNTCKSETTNAMGIRLCGKCGGSDTNIVSGTEMRIAEVELNS
jgi:hydrogenase nickel incorporation protein HypA/HybF